MTDTPPPDVREGSILATLLGRLHNVKATRLNGYGEWTAACPCPHDSEDDVEGMLTATSGDEFAWWCERECTVDDLRDWLFPKADQIETKPPSQWGLVSAAELLAEEIPETRWLYRQIIPTESVSVIFAPPNAGKTFLALHICAEVAAQAAANGFRVAILEWEGTRRALQTRARRACAAAGADPSKILISHNPDRMITEAESLGFLARECLDVDLILLDSLSAAVGDELDENDGAAQGAAAASLKSLQIASRASVLALHHTTKASWAPGQKPSLASLRGHGKLHGRIDTAIGLVQADGDASTVRFELHVVKQRDSEHGKPLRYEVSMMGNDATVTVEEIENESEIRNDSLALDVLAFIRQAGEEGVSKAQIERSMKGSSTRKRMAIQNLKAAGEIEEIDAARAPKYRAALHLAHFSGARSGEVGRGSIGAPRPSRPFRGEEARSLIPPRPPPRPSFSDQAEDDPDSDEV